MYNSYSMYPLSDPFIRTFMIDNNTNQDKFINASEGFLRGNMEKGTYVPYKNMNYISNINNKSVQEPQIKKFRVQKGLNKGENNFNLTKTPKFKYLYANNKIVRIPEENFS